MRLRAFLLPASIWATVALTGCSDPTGPTSSDYVHVLVQNASTVPIYVPAVREPIANRPFNILTEQLLPGAVAEVRFIHPDSTSGGIPVYQATDRPQNVSGVVWFTFVHVPASAAGRADATLKLVLSGQGSLTASTDRPDLILITGVTSS
jgi:hypothetical protein